MSTNRGLSPPSPSPSPDEPAADEDMLNDVDQLYLTTDRTEDGAKTRAAEARAAVEKAAAIAMAMMTMRLTTVERKSTTI